MKLTELHQKITGILGSAGIPTDVSSAIEQAFTQYINDIDDEPQPKRATKKRAAKKPVAKKAKKKKSRR